MGFPTWKQGNRTLPKFCEKIVPGVSSVVVAGLPKQRVWVKTAPVSTKTVSRQLGWLFVLAGILGAIYGRFEWEPWLGSTLYLISLGVFAAVVTTERKVAWAYSVLGILVGWAFLPSGISSLAWWGSQLCWAISLLAFYATASGNGRVAAAALAIGAAFLTTHGEWAFGFLAGLLAFVRLRHGATWRWVPLVFAMMGIGIGLWTPSSPHVGRPDLGPIEFVLILFSLVPFVRYRAGRWWGACWVGLLVITVGVGGSWGWWIPVSVISIAKSAEFLSLQLERNTAAVAFVVATLICATRIF